MVEIESKRHWVGTAYPETTCDVCGYPVTKGYRAVIHYCGEPEDDFGSQATVYLHAGCARAKRYARFTFPAPPGAL